MDRSRNWLFSHLRVLELVALHFCANFLRLSKFIYPCQALFCASLRSITPASSAASETRKHLLAAPNSERSTPVSNAHGRAADRLPKEDANAPKLRYLQGIVLSGLVRPQGAMPVEQIWLRSSTAGAVFRPRSRSHCLQSFLTIPRWKAFRQIPRSVNDLFDTTCHGLQWQERQGVEKGEEWWKTTLSARAEVRSIAFSLPETACERGNLLPHGQDGNAPILAVARRTLVW